MTTEQATAPIAVDTAGYRKAMRKGLMGAFWLALLSLIEFIIAVAGEGESWTLWALLPFVLAKGWIILDVFMHIRALWSEDH
jgi:hypothetical protein